MSFLTATQVGWWLDLSAKKVIERQRDGQLQSLFRSEDEPVFSPDVVVYTILEDAEVRHRGTGILRTLDGHFHFQVVRPSYRFDNLGELCAVFEGQDETWHLRPWATSFISLRNDFDDFHVVLDCRQTDVPIVDHVELPSLQSAHYNYVRNWPLKRTGL